MVCVCVYVMGLSRYQRAIRVLEKYIEDTGKNYIFTQPLRSLIIREIGGDESRTLLPTLRMLRETGIINEFEINKWKINIKDGNNI